MAKFTKAAIIQSFMKLLNEMPFDKITVKDIVDDCGINRNTFYYNFQDIYALVDEILQNEINKIVEKHKKPYLSWRDGLIYTADFALKNKRAVVHLHNSVKRQQFEKYLEKAVYDVVFEFVSVEAKNRDISKNDRNFIASFYSYALLGMLNKWIEDGMTTNFDDVINKISIVLDSNIAHAISAIEKADS